MNFHKIIRIEECPPRADKSAPTEGWIILLMSTYQCFGVDVGAGVGGVPCPLSLACSS
jgi:hypothetical protein